MSPAPQKAEWSGDDVSELCLLGSLVESKLAHEVNLAGHRMSWLVVSESFLFGAFMVITSGNSGPLTSAAKWLMLLLPLVGMALVLLVWPSLFAARNVMQELVGDRNKIDELLHRATRLDFTALGPVRKPPLHKTAFYGDLPLYTVPAFLLLVWIFAVAVHLQIAA